MDSRVMVPIRFRVSPTLRIATGLVLAVLLGVVGYHVLHWRIPGSSEALLEQADEKSWVNNWIAAEPIYRQAELGFIRNHEPSRALYAHVSEIPAQSESSISVPAPRWHEQPGQRSKLSPGNDITTCSPPGQLASKGSRHSFWGTLPL